MSEHDWQRDVRGGSPVLRCDTCLRIWWPDQRQPRSVCRPATLPRRQQRGDEPMSETTTSTGVDLIAAERQRQIDAEGYTPAHDAEHESNDLAWAAARYAVPDDLIRSVVWWPWGPEAWKPCPDDRVRELVKAGALIAAEIDRLNARAAS